MKSLDYIVHSSIPRNDRGPMTISRTPRIHYFSGIRTLKLRKIGGVYRLFISGKQHQKNFSELRRDLPTRNFPDICLMAALLGKPLKAQNDANLTALIRI